MQAIIRPALSLFAAMTLLCGVAYPLAITAVAQVFFPFQANGSLIRKGERVIGSELIGQPFRDQQYFWGRPSAMVASAHTSSVSGGSNLGPSNPELARLVDIRIRALRAIDPSQSAIPVDLVTASGSGLDPHISPASAFYQVPRVARARGLSDGVVRALVERRIEGRTGGILGEARVNVLRLNLALDATARSGI